MKEAFAQQRLVITIDGPAGTGKSTVARMLAVHLGLEFLDTGAMYRAAAALALDRGVPIDDECTVTELLHKAELHFDWTVDPPAILAFGEPICARLRDKDVAAVVSPLAALPALRELMVQIQRRIGTAHPRLVTEGRDQGSVVFPNAKVKFYLDAESAERARRRVEQLRTSGAEADFATVQAAIERRDASDKTRPVGPLVCAQDAQVVDTTQLTVDEVVQTLEQHVRVCVGIQA